MKPSAELNLSTTDATVTPNTIPHNKITQTPEPRRNEPSDAEVVANHTVKYHPSSPGLERPTCQETTLPTFTVCICYALKPNTQVPIANESNFCLDATKLLKTQQIKLSAVLKHETIVCVPASLHAM